MNADRGDAETHIVAFAVVSFPTVIPGTALPRRRPNGPWTQEEK